MALRAILRALIVTTIINLIMADLSAIRRNVAKSFNANTFVPRMGPFGLFKNRHWQTIVGSEALIQKVTGREYPRNFKVSRERIFTPDGDFLDLDNVFFEAQDESVTSKCEAKKATVVILHGLESNTRGPWVTKMTNAFLSKGFSCCQISFRGCSGEDNLTRGAYHVGYTADVDYVCKLLQERNPDTPIYLSGFSLGGNICLKYLGELGDKAHTRNIMGAAVMCVPFDTVECQKKIDQGFNKAVYSTNFLNSLKKKAERQYERFGKETPDFIDIKSIRACSKVGDFDEAFIARIYGFKDKFDYYVQSACKQYLNKIRVPAIAINAIDDPLVDEFTLPTEADDCGDAPVRLIYTAHGGHCGYLQEKEENMPKHGWISEEMSRALEHIYNESAGTLLPSVLASAVTNQGSASYISSISSVSAPAAVAVAPVGAVFIVQSVPVNGPVNAAINVGDITVDCAVGSITKESSATFDSDADIDAALDAATDAASKADINDDIVSFPGSGDWKIQHA